MTCHLCPRVAWYTVGSRGYCGQHKAEADADGKREGVKSDKWPKEAE
jgi:hypothetical protein